jgi:hypothetical protein
MPLVIKKASLVHTTVPYSYIGDCSYANGCPTLIEGFRYTYKGLLLQMIIGCAFWGIGWDFGWMYICTLKAEARVRYG